MSIKKDSLQMSFGDLSAQRILDKCRDHPLLQIKREFSFEQFRDILTPLYSDTGRPAYDPVKMLRLLALGKLHNLSDEMLEFSVLTNILYRAFCGFGLDEDTPDHSTISRFRDRLMPVWDEIWERFLNWLEDKGYLGNSLVIVDSTALRSRGRYRSERSSNSDDGRIDYSEQTDPDARHGHKSNKKPFYGYKGHIAMDGNSDFIVAVETTPGNVFDGAMLPVLVDKLRYLPDAITGDRAYNSVSNSLFLRLRGVEDKTIPRHPRRGRKPRAHKQRKRIERVFSVIKGKFGLARTRFFGLPKVSIEFGLAAFAFNLVNILSIRGSPV